MRLLITGAWKEAEKYIPLIEKQGHSVVFMSREQDRLPCEYSWVEGVICNGLFLYHDIRDFENLKYIQLTSAGLDRVPIDYIKEKNITLNNARGVYSIPMAEFAVTAVLDIYRNSRFFFNNQNNRIWQKDRSLRELFGSAVCIIGCGSVGTECAKRFAALGCEVIGVDLFNAKKEGFNRIYTVDKINLALSLADVVILTLPLTEKTQGLAGKEFFASLRQGCVLVNIARGKIIDTGAMLKAFESKEIYVALDVFEDEPLDENSPLWGAENVFVTPHNSFVSDKTAVRLSKLIIKGLVEE